MQTVRKMVNAYYNQPKAETFIAAPQASSITAMQAELLASGCSAQACTLGNGKTVLVFGGGALQQGYISFDNSTYQVDRVPVCWLYTNGEQVRVIKEGFADMLQADQIGAELAAVAHFKQYVTVVDVNTLDESVLVRLPSGIAVELAPELLY